MSQLIITAISLCNDDPDNKEVGWDWDTIPHQRNSTGSKPPTTNLFKNPKNKRGTKDKIASLSTTTFTVPIWNLRTTPTGDNHDAVAPRQRLPDPDATPMRIEKRTNAPRR